MGQTLSEPVTEKTSTTVQDSRFVVGSSCMQGWRISMDDSHTHILSLPEDPGTAFFAVYDGHGGESVIMSPAGTHDDHTPHATTQYQYGFNGGRLGDAELCHLVSEELSRSMLDATYSQWAGPAGILAPPPRLCDSSYLTQRGGNIAEYAGKHLHKFITARPEYHLGNIEEALKQGFLDLDQAMLDEELLQDKVAGSTAVVVLIKDNTLYCANVGDSRAVASVRGAVEELSYDHKPNNKEELRRITAGGGWVNMNRVNGNLALSRALGDYVFKRNYRVSPREQIVTAYPDVQVRQLTDDWEFIVVACDGIWEVLTNEEVISFCRLRLLSGWEVSAVCEALMQRCLAPNCATGGLGCDNMTVLIACLRPFPPHDHETPIKEPQLEELSKKFNTNMDDLLFVEDEEVDIK